MKFQIAQQADIEARAAERGLLFDVSHLATTYTTMVRDQGGLAWYSQKTPNIEGKDPLFTNATAGDFSLNPSSPLLPMWSTLGFPGIDVAKIGIQKE